MDYKEKYEEALKKAKEIYFRNDATDGGKIILEGMFPELKESEGERIRKAIISIVAFSPEAMFDRVLVSREDAIAWLEKQQKEQPHWSEEDEDSRDIAIRIIQNGGDDCAGILDSDKALKWLKSLNEHKEGGDK